MPPRYVAKFEVHKKESQAGHVRCNNNGQIHSTYTVNARSYIWLHVSMRVLVRGRTTIDSTKNATVPLQLSTAKRD